MKQHWRDGAKYAAFSTVCVAVFMGIVLLLSSMTVTIYRNHKAAMQRIRELHNENVRLTDSLNQHESPKDTEIQRLTKQLKYLASIRF